MNRKLFLRRTLEIIPGAASWSVLALLVCLSFLKPVVCAVAIIIFDFYWIIRSTYLTTLLLMAHHRLSRERGKDWLSLCQGLASEGRRWEELYQLILFPVCNEAPEVLRSSLEALKKSRYPREKMIVVVSFEERFPQVKKNAEILKREFSSAFFAYLDTFHPDGLAGEARTKGANATWAAKLGRKFLDSKGIDYKNVILSCFDADTCVDTEYFGCLTYNFLTRDKPHQASYQPMPVYNNNIWQAPFFARMVETTASFCQMIESMRLEKFVTFSSHSMSFKTLVEIDYWPLNMISDDSVIYWKAFLFYHGDYRVIPLYVNVSMDVAYSSNILKTIAVQYKQKRRWAWGVENFPFVAAAFLRERSIPALKKARRAFHLLESHVTWAVWAVILIFIGPMPILFGGSFFRQMAIGYNLPKITGLLFNFTIFTSVVCIVLSRSILPPRPKGVSRFKNIVMFIEWFSVPLIILILGSSPALEAQSRLMLGRYMEFNPTQKLRR